ncbi:MAG: hypothetical protein ACP5NX_04655 [Candidatus Bilamarchaeaceae archaeon]
MTRSIEAKLEKKPWDKGGPCEGCTGDMEFRKKHDKCFFCVGPPMQERISKAVPDDRPEDKAARLSARVKELEGKLMAAERKLKEYEEKDDSGWEAFIERECEK